MIQGARMITFTAMAACRAKFARISAANIDLRRPA